MENLFCVTVPTFCLLYLFICLCESFHLFSIISTSFSFYCLLKAALGFDYLLILKNRSAFLLCVNRIFTFFRYPQEESIRFLKLLMLNNAILWTAARACATARVGLVKQLAGPLIVGTPYKIAAAAPGSRPCPMILPALTAVSEFSILKYKFDLQRWRWGTWY